MKTTLLLIGSLLGLFCYGQDVAQQLNAAVKKLEADSQFKHAIVSMYVVESKTGKVVFDKNAQIGLAPASCQKVITSVSAFEMLGKDFRYETEVGYSGKIYDTVIKGNLLITGSGDPTLGSWRWAGTQDEKIINKIISALKSKRITNIDGNLITDETKWETQATPRGWIWEDIGNYYGAGARAMNWHENQYDLVLKPGKKTGDPVEIITSKPELQVSVLVNELKTGKEGSGDNSIIYLPENALIGYIRGTIPANKETFTVSGAMPDASISFTTALSSSLAQNKIVYTGRAESGTLYFLNKEPLPAKSGLLLTMYSPSLDSINYWFLKKSINLYGEALVKTIAYEKTKFGSTDTGIAIIKNFWQQKGIEPSALNIIDGSGLSPANRVTTNVLVTVMQYAKKQNWYSSFYNALPEINGIKMKDGYINSVRSYTGYIKSKTGTEYTFSFIVNNFSGSAGTVREKMWKVLDILKF
jgi:D-alanyl-D-alanine carboxypeptidase/D-alanyl-D-alanine-endopeptidase (penicillin-binding protein 4)